MMCAPCKRTWLASSASSKPRMRAKVKTRSGRDAGDLTEGRDVPYSSGQGERQAGLGCIVGDRGGKAACT